MDEYRHAGMAFDVTDAGPADGEAVILLHGYPQTRASWHAVIPHLTDAGYRVLAPDQRGYSPGARPRGRRSYRLDLLAGDVIALMDAAGVARAHVAGHDWGGGVAWGLAAWHPDRLLSMASLATPHPRALSLAMLTSRQALHSWYLLFYQLPWLPEATMRGPGGKLFRRALARSGLAEDAIDTYLHALEQPGAATAAINWYRALPFVSPARIDRIQPAVPVLYVYGTGDVALGRKAADLTGRYVSGPYRYEVLDGASHWLPEERPDQVASLLLDHVRSR